MPLFVLIGIDRQPDRQPACELVLVRWVHRLHIITHWSKESIPLRGRGRPATTRGLGKHTYESIGGGKRISVVIASRVYRYLTHCNPPESFLSRILNNKQSNSYM